MDYIKICLYLFVGDPQLSVMESVLFHELLHVVRIDVPEDDGLVDFLVLSQFNLGLIPDRIYQSHDGRHPLGVTACNITSIQYISLSHVQVILLDFSIQFNVFIQTHTRNHCTYLTILNKIAIQAIYLT